VFCEPIEAARLRFWAGIFRVGRIVTCGAVLSLSQAYLSLFQIDATRYTEG
jgi:hypothetical protein